MVLLAARLLEAASAWMIMTMTMVSLSLFLSSSCYASAKTITIDNWSLPYEGLKRIDGVEAGDEIRFEFFSNAHNVFVHPTKSCDTSGRILVGATSPATYAFTQEDAQNGSVFFSCDIGGGTHCQLGQNTEVFLVKADPSPSEQPPQPAPTNSPPLPPPQPTPTPPATSPLGSRISIEPFSNGGTFTRPTNIVDAFDKKKIMYVTEQTGVIKMMSSKTGKILEGGTPFLDISDRVTRIDNNYSELGLLGLAFHPKYKKNGFFYVNYTSNKTGQRLTYVSRFTRRSDNYFRADPDSELVLLTYGQPYSNHNGGDLKFGPKDGYLYISSGDGGSQGDPQNYAQNLNSYLGKILRIDVDNPSSDTNNKYGSAGPSIPNDNEPIDNDNGLPDLPYSIPLTNPFANTPNALPEIWSHGLRNPWRISFSKNQKDFFIGDVGQNKNEEINIVPGSSLGGEDYGWNKLEGNDCYGPESYCDNAVFTADTTPPTCTYTHDNNNCSVTGGYVYNSKQSKPNRGTYIFGDFCSGRIWSTTKKNGYWSSDCEINVDTSNMYISTFGIDRKGEVYVASYYEGTIHKIDFPNCKNQKQFKFVTNSGKRKKCDWIEKKKKNKRKRKYCSDLDVAQNCKSTCGC